MPDSEDRRCPGCSARLPHAPTGTVKCEHCGLVVPSSERRASESAIEVEPAIPTNPSNEIEQWLDLSDTSDEAPLPEVKFDEEPVSEWEQDTLTIREEPQPGVPLLPTPKRIAPVQESIPMVKAKAVPTVKRATVTPATRHTEPITVRPRRYDDEPIRPKPQLGLALVVMVVLFAVVVIGLSVIGYAMWTGLKSASKSRSEAVTVWIHRA